MHAQDGGLRRIDDRGGHHRTESTTVGDGEGTTSHFVDRQFTVTGLLAEGRDAAFDFRQAHQLGIAQHGHDQTTVAGNGNADVLIAVVNDVAAVDRGVDRREALQRLDGSLDKEGHEAQAHAVVSLLEQLLVLRTQRHDFGHVDFVEGGQHRHVRLCFDQTLGNLGAQAGHRHTLLGAVTGCNDRRSGSAGSRLGCGRSGFLGLDGGNHVFLGDATVLAGALHAVGVDAILFGELASGRREDRLFGAGSGGSSSRSGGRCRCRRWRCRSGGARFQLAEQLAAEHGVAFVLDDFGQHAIGFGEYFHHDLVGLDIDDQFVTLDCFARLLVPGGNGAVSDRFRELGGFDLDSH